MSGKAKRHHTIPEFYLKRFGNCDGQLRVRRRGQPIYLTHARNISAVGKFNTVIAITGEESLVVEELFGEFEAKTAPILREIVDTGAIPTDIRRHWLASFMALLHMRTPEQRAMMQIQEEMFGKMNMYSHTDASIREMLTDMHGREPTTEEFAQTKNAIERIDEFSIELTSNEHFRTGIRVAIDDLAPVMLGMHWRVIESKMRTFFVSDHPILLARRVTSENTGRGIGFGTADYIYFPIDPYHMLFLTKEAFTFPERMESFPTLVTEVKRLMTKDFFEWYAYHPDQSDPLADIMIPLDRPLIEAGGVQIYADGRGMDEALGRVRSLIRGIKEGRNDQVPFIHIGTPRSK